MQAFEYKLVHSDKSLCVPQKLVISKGRILYRKASDSTVPSEHNVNAEALFKSDSKQTWKSKAKLDLALVVPKEHVTF